MTYDPSYTFWASKAEAMEKRIAELEAEVERLEAIVANLTAAILSYGPSQPIRDTNLHQIARKAAKAKRKGDG